jgi:hypothetical protein
MSHSLAGCVEDNRPQRKCPAQRSNSSLGIEINSAIVDRLTFARQIIETGTTAYRLAHARKTPIKLDTMVADHRVRMAITSHMAVSATKR